MMLRTASVLLSPRPSSHTGRRPQVRACLAYQTLDTPRQAHSRGSANAEGVPSHKTAFPFLL